ncbi:DUF1273 family protein, partial [Candidatus Pacearchaeota archaeon]|nr:DUF1273 family protein [Candidatus Pacearchaeota archaeon]
LITGMAMGVDTWFADIAVQLGIPFYAVIPFHGQTAGWKHSDNLHYAKLIAASKKLIVVAKSQSRQAYLNRNTAMVEQSDECIAVWDGSRSGTSHAVGVANKLNVPVDRINPNSFTQE